LINLLHRIVLDYREPELLGRRLNVHAQEAFIAAYDGLMNSLRLMLLFFLMRFIRLLAQSLWGAGLRRVRGLPWSRQVVANVSICTVGLI